MKKVLSEKALKIVLLFALWWVVKNRFSYWKNRGVPYLEPKIPYGNLKGVGKTIETKKFFCDVYESYKNKVPFVGTYFYASPVAFVVNFDLARNIMVNDFEVFHDRKEFYNERDDPLSAHMAHLDGLMWKTVRKKFEAVFTEKQMSKIFPLAAKITDRMVDVIEQSTKTGLPVDIKDVMDRYAMDVAVNMFLGHECDCLHQTCGEFILKGNKVFNEPRHSMKVAMLMQSFPKVARFFNMKVYPDDVSEFFLKSCESVVQYRENNVLDRDDLMQVFLQLKHAGKLNGLEDDVGYLTIDEITRHVFLFSIACLEKISTTITYSLIELAAQQAHQEKARGQILNVLSHNPGDLTYESLTEMKYLLQIVYETLRIYSPITHLSRKVLRDYNVPGTDYNIARGRKVLIPTCAFHMDPEVFSRPNVHNPDNFSLETVSKRHPFSYLPFGEGPRKCIGFRMGAMITLLALAKLLLNYQIQPCVKMTNSEGYTDTSHTKRNLLLRFERRTHCE